MSLNLPSVAIIDSHQHLWDLDRLSLAWLQDPAYKKLARSFLPTDYSAATAGLNIVKTVYVEVDVCPEEQLAEADFVRELCCLPGSRVAGAVLGGRPAEPGFLHWVERFKNSAHVKGFREVLFDKPAGYFLRREFIRGVQQLGERGWSFDVEIPPDLLDETTRLIDACPQTQFVLDHCGHPDLSVADDARWRRHMSECAERTNVAVKISGAFSGAAFPAPPVDRLARAIHHLFDAFGPDRLLYGSDWPVVTLTSSLREWTEAVWNIVGEYDSATIQKVFHDNAVATYHLG